MNTKPAHECRDWDGLLIQPGSPEMDACKCVFAVVPMTHEQAKAAVGRFIRSRPDLFAEDAQVIAEYFTTPHRLVPLLQAARKYCRIRARGKEDGEALAALTNAVNDCAQVNDPTSPPGTPAPESPLVRALSEIAERMGAYGDSENDANPYAAINDFALELRALLEQQAQP